MKPLVPKNYPWQPDLSSSNHKRSSKVYSSSSEALLTSTSQASQGTILVDNERVGVLLLNLGGPETLDDVQPFLFNLFADPVNEFVLSFSFFYIF